MLELDHGRWHPAHRGSTAQPRPYLQGQGQIDKHEWKEMLNFARDILQFWNLLAVECVMLLKKRVPSGYPALSWISNLWL